MNPDDLKPLQGMIDELLAAQGRTVCNEVVADPQVKPGDCMVATLHGTVDARLETRLARIEEELLEGRRARWIGSQRQDDPVAVRAAGPARNLLSQDRTFEEAPVFPELPSSSCSPRRKGSRSSSGI